MLGRRGRREGLLRKSQEINQQGGESIIEVAVVGLLEEGNSY